MWIYQRVANSPVGFQASEAQSRSMRFLPQRFSVQDSQVAPLTTDWFGMKSSAMSVFSMAVTVSLTAVLMGTLQGCGSNVFTLGDHVQQGGGRFVRWCLRQLQGSGRRLQWNHHFPRVLCAMLWLWHGREPSISHYDWWDHHRCGSGLFTDRVLGKSSYRTRLRQHCFVRCHRQCYCDDHRHDDRHRHRHDDDGLRPERS